MRQAVVAQMQGAHREKTCKGLMEQSAADGIMLTMAMQKLPNLKSITIDAISNWEEWLTIREARSSSIPTTTHRFSMILASLTLSGARPHSLAISPSITTGFTDQAVALQALWMPDEMLSGVSKLRQLRIVIDTKDNSLQECVTSIRTTFSLSDSLLQIRILGNHTRATS